MAVDHASLRTHWQLMKDATANDLYAGLAGVSQELQGHLLSSKADDRAAHYFLAIYQHLLPTEANTGGKDKPFDLTFRPKKNVQEDVAEGKRLFEAFAGRFKPTICSQQGVMGILLKGTVNIDEMPLLIATHIINNYLADTKEWYTFSLIVAALIDKQGVENFCG